MKEFCDLGIRIPDILLPKDCDTGTWPVIACDQYTQDRTYWENAEKSAGGKPSALNLILPELYLNDGDTAARIQKIRKTMREYLDGGVFAPAKKMFVCTERRTAYGRIRRGLVAAVDLEKYEWTPFSNSLIRATEATIESRLPPRMEIRRGAPLELPHIMLLVNDPGRSLTEGTLGAIKASGKAPVYSGKLMMNGGSVTGWAADTAAEQRLILDALNKIAEQSVCGDGSVFLFAVGDGNHSLAAAKAVWNEYKARLKASGVPERELSENPVRYALAEIVNIYDEGLTFEPIHRVFFNAGLSALAGYFAEKLGGRLRSVDSARALEDAVKNSAADFGFIGTENGSPAFLLLSTEIKGLAVARFQPAADAWLAEMKGSAIDYIHGGAEVFRLAARENTVGVLMPPVARESFFGTIRDGGPLPRKSFSMGEADEKRFYLECRRLFRD